MDQFYVDTERLGVQENVLALTWHWDCGVCDETNTAFHHYRPRFNQIVMGLRREGIRVVGHAHPRIAKKAQWHYERHGIEWWDHDQVLNEAAVLAVDNSSIGYEFASLGRPVLWLNAPQYRRSVHHGLRFWEYVPGVQIDGPEQFVAAALDCFHRDTMADWRRHVSDLVYPARDGMAARRAAMAIERLL
jgi:CDP-glycerol glycerophosphotransferase (TagB/SpsB family)